MRELGSSPLMRHVGFAGSRNTEVHLRSVCPVEQHEAAKNKENPMAKGQSLQDPFLNALRKERVPVSIYLDRKSTRLNSSHGYISYAVFCLKKKKITNDIQQ